MTGLVTGVEQDEVLGECLVVANIGAAKGLVPEAEVGKTAWLRLSDLVGQEVVCKVINIERRRGVVILSRKAAQDQQAERTMAVLQRSEPALNEARAAVLEARKQLKAARSGNRADLLQALDEVRRAEDHWRTVGPVFESVVRRVGQRAAQVDIGGVLAILMGSEIRHGPVSDCRGQLKVGYGFRVRALHVDLAQEKVWVSRRALLPDPWVEVEQKYKVGGIYLGKVMAIRENDVIVELEPGIAMRVDRYTLGPATGDKVRVLVRKVYPERRWIGGRLLGVVEELDIGRETPIG